MARKKTSKKMSTPHEMIDTKTEDLMPRTSLYPKAPFPVTKFALGVVVVGLAAILYANKGLFVAAIVNGHPIFRWQVTNTMMNRYGKQTLDSMVTESLIRQEADKSHVSVSQSEIDTRMKELVASLGGGVSIDDVLQYQGISKADFENQLKLQITVEKLLGKDIHITDADVDAYIATESATLTATDEAGMRAEARQLLLTQEVNDRLQTWFAGLQAKAKILRFL